MSRGGGQTFLLAFLAFLAAHDADCADGKITFFRPGRLLTCILHQRKWAGAICTSRPMEWELHWSEADNAECIVGVRPDNWIESQLSALRAYVAQGIVQYAG